jgi:uncharacterized membrane protein
MTMSTIPRQDNFLARDKESIALPRLRGRIESVDLLRSLIIVVMSIDHTRDFFSNAVVDPADPVHSWPALFATRWITHICAPGSWR